MRVLDIGSAYDYGSGTIESEKFWILVKISQSIGYSQYVQGISCIDD